MSSSKNVSTSSSNVPSATASQQAATPILTAHNISKWYHFYSSPLEPLREVFGLPRKNNSNRFCALENVSLEVYPGECIGIIGRNGAGKSTLMQILAGTLQPSEGDLTCNGRIAALLELGTGFNPDFTGRENIFLNGGILGLKQVELQERYDAIVSFADIGVFIDQPVKYYSTGMFARLAFAIALEVEPKLLLIDEILAVGDASFQRKCFRRLDELLERGVSILLVSHSIDIIRSRCSRCLYLEHGKPKMYGDAPDACDLYLQDVLEERSGNGATTEASQTAAVKASVRNADPEAFITLCSFTPDEEIQVAQQGTGSMQICSARLLFKVKHGNPAPYSGDTIVCKTDLLATQEIHDGFVFGFLLRDRFGNDVFGISYSSEQLGLRAQLHTHDRLRIVIDVRCDLRPDTYFVTLGIQDCAFENIFAYAHDALSFELHKPDSDDKNMIGGLARLQCTGKAEFVSAVEGN